MALRHVWGAAKRCHPPSQPLNTSSVGVNWGRRGFGVLPAGPSPGKETLKGFFP